MLIARQAKITAREIAFQLGITERSVQRIISHLEAGGYLAKKRSGRTNSYEIDHNLPMRRPEIGDTLVDGLLQVLVPTDSQEASLE